MASEEMDLSEFSDEADQLRKQIADLQRRLQAAKTKTADLVEAVYRGAKDATVAVGSAPRMERPKADRRSKRAEVCLLPVSDWHIGKRTASFNSEVAAERVQRLAVKVAEITEIERADHPVRECHLALLGDFTDGVMIFPGHPFEVDSTLFTQMMNAAASVEGLIRSLLATFPVVHVWCQTGNHGRIGKRGDMPRGDNTDRLLYRIVRDRFGGQDLASRLHWHEPQSWYSIMEIGSYRALLIHGDQIKSFGGNTPAFGILRKCNSWASGVLPAFHDVWMGHFHQPLVLPLANGAGRVFVSPSIESDSEYAREFVAATGTPSQRLAFIDPEKGRVTSERLLWLS